MFMAAEPAIQPAGLEGMIHIIRGQRMMQDSSFAAIRQLIELPAEEQRREMGFRTLREKAAAYGTRQAKKRV